MTTLGTTVFTLSHHRPRPSGILVTSIGRKIVGVVLSVLSLLKRVACQSSVSRKIHKSQALLPFLFGRPTPDAKKQELEDGSTNPTSCARSFQHQEAEALNLDTHPSTTRLSEETGIITDPDPMATLAEVNLQVKHLLAENEHSVLREQY